MFTAWMSSNHPKLSHIENHFHHALHERFFVMRSPKDLFSSCNITLWLVLRCTLKKPERSAQLNEFWKKQTSWWQRWKMAPRGANGKILFLISHAINIWFNFIKTFELVSWWMSINIVKQRCVQLTIFFAHHHPHSSKNLPLNHRLISQHKRSVLWRSTTWQ